MEENEKEKTLEYFIKDICQKYCLDENILLENINQDKTTFWNTLIEQINKNEELHKLSNSINDENIEDIENTNHAFNKEELINEIDIFIRENPDEDNEIWKNFKNNNTESLKDNNIQIDNNNAPASASASAPAVNKNDKPEPAPAIKKTFTIKKDQKLRFSIKVPKKRKNQSIIMQPNNSNTFLINQKINKRESKLKLIRSKFNKDKKKTKRRSLALKVDNNTNLEYNNKKLIEPVNRRSLMPNYHFKNKYNLNNSVNKKNEIIPEENKTKNSNQKNGDKNKEKDDNKKDIIYINENENESESENSSIYSYDNKKDEDKKKNENENENEENKVIENKDDNLNNTNDNNEQNTEKKVLPVYKYKSTVSTIYKKENPKPKPKKEPKKYLNNSVCHQVSISLNIMKKSNIKSKSKNKNSITSRNERCENKIKISTKTSKTNMTNDNNTINVLYKKEIINQPDEKTHDNLDEDNYFNERKLFNSERKRNRQLFNNEYNNNNNYNNSRIKIYNNSFYRININETYNVNNYRSTENINNLKTAQKPFNATFSSKKEIIPKQAEIKFYKTSGKNNNKSSKKINDSNIKRNCGTIKKIKVKKEINNNINNYTISTHPKKKPFIQRYKDAIESITKNDDTIFNANNILYKQKSIKKKHKAGNSIETQKKKEIPAKINFNWKNSRNKQSNKKIKILKKKNIFSSTDNIYKNKNNQ